MQIETHTDTLTPWSDVSRIVNNAKSMTVVAGGKKYRGKMKLDIDEQGHVTLEIGRKPGRPKK